MRQRNSGGRCSASQSDGERALRIEAGDHGACLEGVAGGERDAHGAVVARPRPAPPPTPVRMSTPCRVAARRSAAPPRPGPPSTSASREGGHAGVGLVEQQLQPAAGGPRAQHRAQQAIGGDDRAEELGLEHLAHQVGHGHRPPAQQPPRIVLRQRAEGPDRPHRGPQVVGAGIVHVGRRAREERAHDPGDTRQRVDEGGPGVGVVRRTMDGWPRPPPWRRRRSAARAPRARAPCMRTGRETNLSPWCASRSCSTTSARSGPER